MGKVLTLQEFVFDTFRSKSDWKYKEMIKRNGVHEKTPVIVIVGAIGKTLNSCEPHKRYWIGKTQSAKMYNVLSK